MSNAIRKFLDLPPSRRKLFIEALVIVAAVRLGLWVIPFPRLKSLVLRIEAKLSRDRSGIASSSELAWAIEAASRFVPKATCLTQAMAAKILFSIHGRESLLRIGVARGGDGRMLAHAWLESQGRAVVGGQDFEYTPLLSVK